MAILSSSSLSFHYYLFFTILTLAISALILFASRRTKSKRVNLPPGPPGWPIVGNLFQVSLSGKSFFKYVDHLIPKYGPIFTLKMGTKTLIILSESKLIHEALIENGSLFHSRPPENPTRAIFSCDKFTVNSALYGPVWRSLRRNMVQNMLSSSKLKEFRCVREKAMDKFINRLKAEAQSNDGAVWVLKNARFAVFCVLLAMCFGIDMEEETVEKMDQMMKTVLITADPRIDDYLPILSPFFSKQRQSAREVRKEQVDFVAPFIEKRRKMLQNPELDKTAMSFSYLDTLFNLKVEERKSERSNAELVTLCSEFLNGGTDTTGTAIEWGIAQLIANPDVQAKLYDEIKNKVGDRKVDEKDAEKMPYLKAVVNELLRKNPPVYFSLIHAVTEPTTLAGYDIPTEANVLFYLPVVANNPEFWSNPEKFDPDRFVSGGEDPDVTGVSGVKMIPFGVGRRICPGLGMAVLHLQLMLARMVQEFEWSSYPPNSMLDFTGKYEFTVVMKNALRAMIKPREN